MTNGLGIVLSGGGARGFAHAGVFKALHEHGVEPEFVAGSSSGALVGALYAAGYDAEEMLEFFIRNNPFKLSNLAMGKPGWIDTKKVAADFLTHFPEDSFESLNKKLFVTATDIVNGEPAIFESGPLISAILASCSVPVVFTPTEIDGHWYSDGGITNNFPVEPLAESCDRILGVYASPIRSVRQADLSSSVSIWQRAMELGMYTAAKVKFDRCGLVICPEALSPYGLFDARHTQAIFDIGYRATLDRMDEILRVVGDSR